MAHSYTISISEEQRHIIEEALCRLYPAVLGSAEAIKERAWLLEAVRKLPKDEAETPRVVHGLCL